MPCFMVEPGEELDSARIGKDHALAKEHDRSSQHTAVGVTVYCTMQCSHHCISYVGVGII
jgi:hypothetical protein